MLVAGNFVPADLRFQQCVIEQIDDLVGESIGLCVIVVRDHHEAIEVYVFELEFRFVGFFEKRLELVNVCHACRIPCRADSKPRQLFG